MDPGTALGAASLAFQLFSGCIKGCKVLSEAIDMPKEYDYLRHRLKLEELKLLEWWLSSPPFEDIDHQDPLAQTKKQLIIDSLDHIKALTYDLRKIKERYNLALEEVKENHSANDALTPQILVLPLEAKRRILRDKAIEQANKSWKAYPKRLRWVAFDGAKFERLVLQFAELNNFMSCLLDSEGKRQQLKLQEDTSKEVLKVHNRLDTIEQLIRSIQLQTTKNDHTVSRHSEISKPFELEQLARFKAFKIATIQQDAHEHKSSSVAEVSQNSTSNRLDISKLQLSGLNTNVSLDSPRSMGIYDCNVVCIEWKVYEVDTTTLSTSVMERRISCLSTLLKNPAKPEDLRLPPCIGYFHDPTSPRFGLVFGSPLAKHDSTPESLYSKLQTQEKPSLSLRIAIAQRLAKSLDYLHAANWLHKGLRSDNVLFSSSTSADWLSFWLSGFDYSRPADPGEATELPIDNREHELYRHPDVQFDVPRDGRYGFKKQHDIYSLGVILLEIGVWQPIHQFLGISLNKLIKRPVAKGVKKSLLKESSISMLESEAGQIFAEAVKLCLDGEVVAPPNSSDNLDCESEQSISLQSGKSLDRAIDLLNSIIV